MILITLQDSREMLLNNLTGQQKDDIKKKLTGQQKDDFKSPILNRDCHSFMLVVNWLTCHR